MPIFPWLKNKKEAQRAEDIRSHNTDEENKLLDLATARFNSARASKVDSGNQDLHSKWRECDRMYRGDQWAITPPEHKSMPVLNYTFGFVESVVSRLIDNRPNVVVRARRDAKNEPLAKQLCSLQEYLWDYNKMPQRLPEAVRMCLKYGTVIFKAVWDTDKYDGLGEVIYSVVHPMNFFNDPRAYTVEEMDFCFVVMPKSLEYLRRRFSDKADLIEADEDWTDTEQVDGSDNANDEMVATLYEYWFRDSEGNVCVMYYTKNVVLQIIGGEYDNHKPVYKHNKFPFAKFVDYPVDKHFWGAGEIEQIVLLQRLINDIEAQIVDNTRLMANGQIVVNKRLSGLREEDSWALDNSPGNIIYTNEGGVEFIKGTGVPEYVPNHLQFLVQVAEQVLGVHDVVQGMRPQGVRAASAIIALGEAANIRVRAKASQLEHAVREIADQGNWLALEFYDTPRQIRVTGTSTITELDVRKVMVNRMAQEGVDAGIFGTDFPTDNLDMEQQEQVMDEIKFPEFDVEVHVGPSVPYSQALLYEQAKEFYTLGIIDRQAVLEATNFPNKEAILQRIEGAEAVEQGERVGERTFGNGSYMQGGY